MDHLVDRELERVRQGLIKEAQAPRRSLGRDFLAGIDPTGGATFQYGMKDVETGRRGAGLRRAVGTAGGVVGGAVIVPSAISGLIGGVKGLKGGKSLGGRLLGAGRGFLSGAVAPFQKIYHATRAKKALGVAAAGKRMSDKHLQGLHGFARTLPGGQYLGDLNPEAVRAAARRGSAAVERAGRAADRIPAAAGKARSAIDRATPYVPGRYQEARGALSDLAGELSKTQPGAAMRQWADQITPEMARRLQEPVSSRLSAGLATLGTSGVLGGGGAYLQYGKGRQAAQRYQQEPAAKTAAAYIEKESGVLAGVLKRLFSHPVRTAVLLHGGKGRVEGGLARHQETMRALLERYPAGWVPLGMRPRR